MGSSSPVAQHYQHPNCLPTQPNSPQFATSRSSAMESQVVGAKAPVNSVYPSPADDPINSFSAPSSPLYQQDRQVLTKPSEAGFTLPPLSSILQMPSPSTSPQMSVASHRCVADEYLKSPAMSDNLNPSVERSGMQFGRPDDVPLFSERLQANGNANSLPPLFPPPVFPVQAVQGRASHQTFHLPNSNPRRIQKAVAEQSLPLLPDSELYGRGNIWARTARNPQAFFNDNLREMSHQYSSMRTSHEDSHPYHRPSQDNVAMMAPPPSPRKRKLDSPVEPEMAKRHRSHAARLVKPSASPRDVPIDLPDKKRVRRAQDPNKAKVPRAPSEKVERNYMLYPDYCPSLSTLDSDEVTFPNIDWKAAPLDLDNYSDKHLLHPKELSVASKLVLAPAVYVYIKRRFFASRVKYARNDDQKFNINAAQIACKGTDEYGITGIDVNKTSRLHKAFEKVGWLDKKHVQRFL